MGRRRSGIYSAHESGDRPEVNITTVLRRAISGILTGSSFPSWSVCPIQIPLLHSLFIEFINVRVCTKESDHAKMPFSGNDCSIARFSHECIFAANADHQE